MLEHQIGSTVVINNKEWLIAEYRMARGREWVYTLSYEQTDGSHEVMRLNPEALKQILRSGNMSEETIYV